VPRVVVRVHRMQVLNCWMDDDGAGTIDITAWAWAWARGWGQCASHLLLLRLGALP